MAATLLDYKASEPSNVQGGGVLPGGVVIPATITAAPTVTVLADLGIFLTAGAPNRVELKASIGVEGTVGIPQLSLIIQRDGVQILATQQGLESGFERFYTVDLEGVDFNVAAGFHTYTLSVSDLAAGTAALVVGPVVFTGTAYSVS